LKEATIMAYARNISPRESAASGSVVALANGLGWFSIALGAAEVIAPKMLTRTLGLEGNEGLVRAYGLREIASGIGILSSQDPTPWIWSRVGGDALDLATLASGLDDSNPRKQNVEIALAAVAGITALDVYCGRELSANGGQAQIEQRQTYTPVRDYSDRSGFPRPPEEMRGAARDFKAPKDMRTPAAMRPHTAA
jgi:hypothetical protein